MSSSSSAASPADLFAQVTPFRIDRIGQSYVEVTVAGTRKTVYQTATVKVEYDIDSYKRGMARCALGPELTAAVVVIAERGKGYAVGISPRSTRQHQHYQDSFTVILGTETLPDRFPMKRVCARLWNLAPQAAAVEWGNAQTNGDGHQVLRKTLAHLEHL